MSEPLRVMVSIRRGAPPGPGVERRRWEWGDVLARPPPRQAVAPDAAFTLRHGLDDGVEDPETRIGYATRMLVERDDEGNVRRVVADELVSVEPRVLSPVLVVERSVTRRVAAGSRMTLQLVERGSQALSTRVGGRGGVAITRGTGATVRVIEWAGQTVRDAVRTLVEAPDSMWAGATTSSAHLKRGRDRKALLMGMLNPYALSREGKAAALFLAGAAVIATMLAVTLGVFLFSPDLLVPWRSALLFFMLGIGGTLLFPAFPEFRLFDVADSLRPVFPGHTAGMASVLTIAAGMTIGAWLVLFLGDAIHGTLRAGLRPGSRLARGLDWAEAFARRRGFWAAFIPLAIPLGPDTPVFYMLASLRTPPVAYLLGTFLGLTVRFSLWYFVPVLWYDVILDRFTV